MITKASVDIHPAVKLANARRVRLETRYYSFTSRILEAQVFGLKIACGVILAGLVGLALWQ